MQRQTFRELLDLGICLLELLVTENSKSIQTQLRPNKPTPIVTVDCQTFLLFLTCYVTAGQPSWDMGQILDFGHDH